MSDAGHLSLVGGALALDFANTAAGRDQPEPHDHLLGARDLVDWAEHAGIFDAQGGRAAHAAVGRDAEADDRLLRHARSVREAIHAVGMAIASGRPPPPGDLDTIKEFGRRALAPARIGPAAGDGYAFDFAAAPLEYRILGPVAWSAIDLLQGGRLDRLKLCPGHGCGWLFLDTSKNNSRRWCDMATCGNRAKVDRHRHRH